MNLVDTIRLILKQKDHNVWSVSPDSCVYEAIEIMADKHVGALLVVSEGNLVGVVSERDYARKVILQGKSSKEIQVSEIMTSPVILAFTWDSKSRTRRRAALVVWPDLRTMMTESASIDKSTASVTDKAGGVSMTMWSNSSLASVFTAIRTR